MNLREYVREFWQEEKNQAAFYAWLVGALCLVISCYWLLQGMRPINLLGWVIVIQAVTFWPIGWGLYCRSTSAKWIFAAFSFALFAGQLLLLYSAPSAVNIILLIFAAVIVLYAIQLDLRDILQQLDELRKDPHYNAWLDQELEKYAPIPLPSSSVYLHGQVLPVLDGPLLSSAVSKAFKRPCRISEERDNIGLGVEFATATNNEAVIGGAGIAWMICVRPVLMNLLIIPGGESSDAGSSKIIVSLDHQLDREAHVENGYVWTIPLAAALWSDDIEYAATDGERRYKTRDELFAAIKQLGP